jgi:hypothetical protein
MTPRLLALLAGLGALGACDGGKTDPTDTDDPVGDDTADTDTDTAVGCEAAFLSVDPLDGAGEVYYRAPIVVSFEGDAGSAAFALADAGGAAVDFDAAWSDGNVQATLTTVLAAETSYTLTVDLCGATTVTTFTTSSLGKPLEVEPGSLVGNTYVWRLSDADITEPFFLDALAGTYLTVPLLINVTAADDATLDLLGGLGYPEDDGSYTQQMGEETWDFPSGDFSEQPYFEAYADRITITYDGTPIPIEQFHLAGTFSADGTRIEKGVGSGLGDSRYMGPLLRLPEDDLDAVCEIAAEAGVECQPCGDGEPYCIPIVAEEITAVLEEGLVLEPVD